MISVMPGTRNITCRVKSVEVGLKMVVEGMKALRGIMSMVRNSYCLSVC